MSWFMSWAKVHFQIVKFGYQLYLFSISDFNLHSRILVVYNRLTKCFLGIFCSSFLDSINTKFMHVASKSNIIFMSENCRKRKFDF